MEIKKKTYSTSEQGGSYNQNAHAKGFPVGKEKVFKLLLPPPCLTLGTFSVRKGEDSQLSWYRQVWRFIKGTWLDLYRGQSNSPELKHLISTWVTGLVFLIWRVIYVRISCSLQPAGNELFSVSSPSWYVQYKDTATV